jgi:N-acetylglucosamine malate deacetylase 1
VSFFGVRVSRVCVVAPHRDDETIGCGGLLRLLSDEGASVAVVHVFDEDDPPSPQAEAQEACDVLGAQLLPGLGFASRGSASVSSIARELTRVFREWRPLLILSLHSDEQDQDHSTVARAVTEATWMSSFPTLPALGPHLSVTPSHMAYEVWTPLGAPNVFVDITSVLHAKTMAMNCYGSQLARTPWLLGMSGLAQYRGCVSGAGSHVEAYSLVSAMVAPVSVPFAASCANHG